MTPRGTSKLKSDTAVRFPKLLLTRSNLSAFPFGAVTGSRPGCSSDRGERHRALAGLRKPFQAQEIRTEGPVDRLDYAPRAHKTRSFDGHLSYALLHRRRSRRRRPGYDPLGDAGGSGDRRG